MARLKLPLVGNRTPPALEVGMMNNGCANFDMMAERVRGHDVHQEGLVRTPPVPPTNGFELMDNRGFIRDAEDET